MNSSLELIHVWNRCHACGAQPIAGLRFECQTCPIGPDNDLCEACYRLHQSGAAKHPLPDGHASHLRNAVHRFRAFTGQSRDRHTSWIDVPFAGRPAPSLPSHFVVRPEFRCGLESFFGTYAFVAEPGPGKALVLTALHVMDELIKAKGVNCSSGNQTYTGKELPEVVTRVDLYDVFAPNWMLAELGSARSMLILPEARVGEPEPFSQRDIAAFYPDPSALVTPAPFASRLPNVGEPVWLVANSGPGKNGRTIEAVIVEVTEQTLVFRFAQTDFSRRGSGAPLVNSEGGVVGINVGSGFLSGCLLGHANHVGNIRRHLDLARKPSGNEHPPDTF